MKKERIKKADLKTKAGKYIIARAGGKNKGESALEAGYADTVHTGRIEKSKTYLALEKKYFKDTLEGQITLEEVATELIKNIKQDSERGAKNKAIEIALSKLEPEERQEDDDEKVLVILKG